eukprot:COSAG02_NODE_47892_length_338_cov_0.523013_2_plen_22_part_01
MVTLFSREGGCVSVKWVTITAA